MIIHKIKGKMPEPLKMPYRYAVSIIPYSWRYGGKRYKETRQFLLKSQWWSEEQHEEYQIKELKRLLCHAYDHTQYYKSKFGSIACRPEEINTFEDFRKMPFLTKDDVKNNLYELKATNMPAKDIRYGTTGGSTGNPVGFYERKIEREKIELAFNHTLFGRIGYRAGDKIGVLRGNIVPKKKDDSHWLFNPKTNELLLSSYHLTEKSVDLYATLVNKFRIKYLHVYPSAVTLFAKYLDGRKMSFPYLKGILCASEMLYDWQRKLISEAFNCRVFSHYGLSERAALGGECEYSSKIHIFPEYGYTELIDDKGNQITKPGLPGEIVATGFTNYATPFIRYRTGDIGVLSSEKCGCGRNYPLFEHIEGRTQDFVITEKGKKITLTALIFAQHFHAFGRLKKLQIEQKVPGKITLRIVKDAGFSRRDEDEISQKISSATSGGIVCSFEYVEDMSVTKRGKHRFLIQKLDVGFMVSGNYQ